MRCFLLQTGRETYLICPYLVDGLVANRTRSLACFSRLTPTSRKESIQFDKARPESRTRGIFHVLTRRVDYRKDTQALLWA